MPKSKEQRAKEVKENVRKFYDAKDVSGLMDYLEEMEERVQPSIGTPEEDLTELDAFTEQVKGILGSSDPHEAAVFFTQIQEECMQRKVKYISQTIDVMEKFEEKIKNKEIPGTEHYADDPKSVEKLAAAATRGSAAMNRAKNVEAIGHDLGRAIREYGMENRYNDFESEFNKEISSRPDMAALEKKTWEELNLSPEKIEKAILRLECNLNDGGKEMGYDIVPYHTDKSGVFEELSDEVQEIQGMTDQQLADEKLKTVENSDPYIKFYQESKKIEAYLNVWQNVSLGAMMYSMDDETKKKAQQGVFGPYDTLRNNLNYFGSFDKQSPETIMQIVDRAISSTNSFITTQKNEELDRILSGNGKEFDEKNLQHKNLMNVASISVEKLTELKENLQKQISPEVQEKFKEPFEKYAPDKLKAIEENNKKLKLIETEQALRKEEREKSAKTKESLNNFLSYGGNGREDLSGSFHAAGKLIEAKSLGTSRVDLAQKKSVSEFVDSLKNTTPVDKTNLSFITDLGTELSEREAKAKKKFDKQVKDLKADILENNMPGVYNATPEIAEAIAKDVIYNTTKDGKELKAIHEVKNEVFGSISESERWKNYVKNHPEIAESFAAPKMGHDAAQYGYHVTDDFSKQISGSKFEKMPKDAEHIMLGDKHELETLRDSKVKALSDADNYEAMVGDLSAQAKMLLDTLSATNKAGHKNSKSFNRMTSCLKNLADLKNGTMINEKGQEVPITHEGITSMLNDLNTASAEYQEAHSGLFSGNSKGFGRTRYNASVIAKSMAQSAQKQLKNKLSVIDPKQPIVQVKNSLQNEINVIDDAALDKGYGQLVRKPLSSPEKDLDKFIKEAEKENVSGGSDFYRNAIADAKTLKTALSSGNPEQIAAAANTAKESVNKYINYKRNQLINEKEPNKKGWQRINAMGNLRSVTRNAIAYGLNLAGAEKDIAHKTEYTQKMEEQKQAVLDAKVTEERNIQQQDANLNSTVRRLKENGITQMKMQNEEIYRNRSNDEKLQGIDKISAKTATNAFEELDSLSFKSEFTPEQQQQAKQLIAELVLDKMVQFDHGNVLHKKCKNMNEQQFKDTAKTLSESKEFKAAVPDKINKVYIIKFLADHDGHGVMQVKNSVEKYRKATKSINPPKPPKQPELDKQGKQLGQ